MTTNLYYLAGFTVTSTGALAMGCTIAGNAATITAGNYAHEGMTNTIPVFEFDTQVAADFVTAGGGPWSVSWSTTTWTYTISRATNFTLVFPATTAGNNLADALGFARSASLSGANSYTSTRRPYFVVAPYELARSQALPYVYEPSDIVEEAVTDGGDTYSVAKNTDELWSDWTQTMEPKATCFDRNAVSSAPWTWQMFFKHVRGAQPFMVVENGAFWVYKLRAEGAFFKADPVSADWDSLYNIKFHARYLGDNA